MSTGVARSIHGIRGMADRANAAFAAAAVAVPLLALAYGLAVLDTNRFALTYVHVMAGVLWTGIDLFVGIVLGPVLGGLDPEERASVFERFTPKMTFLMPVLAAVTITGGVTLARRVGYLPNADPWLALMTAAILVPVVLLVGVQFDALTDARTLAALGVVVVASGAWIATTYASLAMPENHWVIAALGVVTLLSVFGFGVVLPGEVKIYREIVSPDPDTEVISRIGMRNARLGGLQGVLQLGVILVMTVGLKL